MTDTLLGCGTETAETFALEDYADTIPRWCPGCGDHGVLTAVERVLEKEQMRPEQTVFVSGIGCSSRFPHYLDTYGFHGLHGRALPVATGVKLTRPELNVFVVMGDGDCTSIGAGHWLHALRYNMNMVALMLDNEVYGLTKNQTSPTTPQGFATNTQPRGSYLPPLNPLSVMLGMTNTSFIAQTADWVPSHLYETILAASRHNGFAFVRVLQRCPVFSASIFDKAVKTPDLTELLVDDKGIMAKGLSNIYKNQLRHDPSDLDRARWLSQPSDKIRLGLFYQNESLPKYEETRTIPGHTTEDKLSLLEMELDRYAV
jgi:2-oxoglutarate ferredoxin oxidoreductase subunit beta